MLWALSPICAACLTIAQLLLTGDEEHSEKTLSNRMNIENFILTASGRPAEEAARCLAYFLTGADKSRKCLELSVTGAEPGRLLVVVGVAPVVFAELVPSAVASSSN